MYFLSAALRTASRTRPSVALPRITAAPRLQPLTLQRAWYRAPVGPVGLPKKQIQERVMEVLRAFEPIEKVKAETLTPTASFTDDLGLDSLDVVEVVMAIEEEFAIEIPDAEADEIKTVQQAIDYIEKTPDAK